MATKQLPLSGIVRNLPDNNVPDGAIQELINLRPKDGALRPVGVKTSISSTPTDVRYIHVINSSLKIYIGTSEGKIAYWVYSGVTLLGAAVTTVDSSVSMSFASLHNTLVISNNANEVTTTLVFDQQTIAYKEYTTLVPDMPFISFQRAVKNDDDENGGGSLIITDDPAPPDAVLYERCAEYTKGVCLSLAGRKRDIGYLIGRHMVRVAWELFDGSLVMQSIPHDVFLSSVQFTTTGSLQPDGFHFVVSTTFTGYKLQYKVNIATETLTAIKNKYKGVVRSLNIYMTAGRGIKDIKFTSFENTTQYAMMYDNAPAADINTWIGKEYAYYLAESIPLDTLTADTFADILMKNSNDLTVQAVMPTGNFSCHGLTAKRLFAYNQRIFMGNIKNILYPGQSLSGYISPVGSAQAGAEYSLSMVYYLDTTSGTKIVRTPWEAFTYYNAAGTQFAFHIPAITGYPDARAKMAKLFMRDPSNEIRLLYTFTLTPVTQLNFSYCLGGPLLPEAGTSGLGLAGPLSNYTITALPTTDNSYSDYNRVQATEYENPFYYPPINSYRVGVGEVLGMSSNAIALSQGQFGQFPVFCFCSDGIWAMNIGSGELLINTISPLSREVCNNPASITPIDGGVAFSTAKGLHVISGARPIEISEQAEGKFAGWIASSLSYQAITANPNLYQLSTYLCTATFLTYLSGASIGYDQTRDELIISNGSYAYSWVYCFKYKAWFKISQVFDKFVNDYPITYGYRSGRRYDMTSESYSSLVAVHVETRPIKLAPGSYKKLLRTLLEGLINDNDEYPFSMNLFGSVDGHTWHMLGSGNIFDERTAILIGRSNYSCAYFVVVAGGKVDESSYLTQLSCDFEQRYSNKLRV